MIKYLHATHGAVVDGGTPVGDRGGDFRLTGRERSAHRVASLASGVAGNTFNHLRGAGHLGPTAAFID